MPEDSLAEKYRPDVMESDDATLARMNEGSAIGGLAMGLFGDFTEVTVQDDESLDFSSMIRRIQEEMEKGTPEDRDAARHNLLKYCELDTFAMVKVWQALMQAAQ